MIKLLSISVLAALASCGSPVDPLKRDHVRPPHNDGAPSGEPVIVDEIDLWGGKVASSSSLAARSIVPIYYQATDGNYYLLCTGTLLSSTKVLTAAHCISDANKTSFLGVITNPVAVGVGGTNAYRPSAIIPVSQIAPDTNYRYWYEGNYLKTPYDTAVLTLSAAVPAVYNKKAAVMASSRAKPRTTYKVAGYGKQSDANAPDGNLYESSIAVSGFDSVGTIVSTSMKTGLCSGDSGGPLYQEVNGTMVIYGVLSWAITCRALPSYNGHWDSFKNSTWIKAQ
jgi:secreted trypsin-like serine protease